MLRASILGLCLALALASAAGRAADDAPVIGFVDIAYLIDNSPQSQRARERLEAEFLPRQQELTELRDERARAESALTGVDGDEGARAERDLRALERRLQRLEQAFREDLNIKRNDELKRVRTEVLESVAVFARQQGFDLILTDGVLYASTSVDVTQRVLEQLRGRP